MRESTGAAVAAIAALSLAGGCAVGPDYRRPSADLPDAWQPDAPWHAAAPRDAAFKGRWWELFGDPELDALMRRALEGNQALRSAAWAAIL